jgi:hypothetical protein
MSQTVQIFVKLLAEGVDVWRPVQAVRESEGIYRIVEQPYDRDTEIWEFDPGDIVVCEVIESSGGSILAATRPSPR